MTQTLTSQTDQRTIADEAWSQLESMFTNQRGMVPSSSWLYGLGDRVNWQRLQRLENSETAKKAKAIFSSLTDGQLAYIKDRAHVNMAEAEGALRLFLIANISVPVGALFLINQIFPNALATLTAGFDTQMWITQGIAISIAILMLISTTWFTYAGVRQSRDLYFLCVLTLSRRQLGLKSGELSTANSPDFDTASLL